MKDNAAPRQPREQREKRFQREAVQWLGLAVPGCHVYEFAPVGGRPKCSNCGKWVGNLAGANPPGWFDMLLVIPAAPWPMYIHIENKADDNDLTDEQKLMWLDLAEAGARRGKARTIKDLYAILVANGIRPRLEAG